MYSSGALGIGSGQSSQSSGRRSNGRNRDTEFGDRPAYERTAAGVLAVVARDGEVLSPAEPSGGRNPLAVGVLGPAGRGIRQVAADGRSWRLAELSGIFFSGRAGDD